MVIHYIVIETKGFSTYGPRIVCIATANDFIKIQIPEPYS